MISLYVFIAILIIAGISTFIGNCFHFFKNRLFRSIFTIEAILLFCFMTIFITVDNDYSNKASELRNEYNELTLYYSTVDKSTNEYVRYDYYNKVLSFNSEFERFKNHINNDTWFRWLCPDDALNELDFINFELRGEDYYG